MGETILVTGATGMLGAHLLYKLVQQGYAVRATFRDEQKQELTNRIFGYYADDAEELMTRVGWVKADLMNVTDVERAMAGIEKVYHCAALVSFDDRDSEALIRTNPSITANVVNVALDFEVNKLVYASSVAALGRTVQGKLINEKAQWIDSKQNSVYAKSKYLAELEVWRGSEEGLNVAIVNPTIILGPGNWSEGSAAVFNTIAKGFKFYTEGVNGYVDARDVAEVMCKLMESDISKERFVLVGENLSYREVFSKIALALDAPRPHIHARPWMGNLVWRLAKLKSWLFGGKPMVTKETAHTAHQLNLYDSSKISETLNFSFRPIEKSILDFARFYRKDHSS